MDVLHRARTQQTRPRLSNPRQRVVITVQRYWWLPALRHYPSPDATSCNAGFSATPFFCKKAASAAEEPTEIETPLIEQAEVFERGVGDVTDIVEKEMYAFEDRGGEQIALRPEFTAGCVRAGIEHGLFHNQQQRLWCAGPVFRYDGTVVAAMSVSAPTSRMTREAVANAARRCVEEAAGLSSALGYRPRPRPGTAKTRARRVADRA